MTTNRRLAAIVMADVVGYSRMMEQDEAGTLAALKERRKSVLEPVVKAHGGRIVKVMGDGVLVEFASAVNAVQGAIELQKQMAAASEGVEEAKRIVLRIGINLGDVIGEGSDIYGEGVNIAARLEAIAEPGGICMSAKVEEEVRGKLKADFADMGEQTLRNIVNPVRAFRVALAAGNVAKAAIGKPSKNNLPAIAVLAFNNLSGDADQEYLSDGITEDIITELSRFKTILVIARNSSFALKGQTVDLRDVGQKLNVRYIVEGSVRKVGQRIRITAQLIDTESGVHIWANRYDRDLADVFEVQDELVRTIVSTIGGRIEVAGKVEAKRLSDNALRAYDLYLRAAAAEDRNTREDYRKARGYLEQAIRQDPSFTPALHRLSLVNYVEWMAFWADDRAKAFSDSISTARQALALDDSNSSLHAHFGILLMYSSDYEVADAHFRKAFELNPNDSKGRSLYGFYLTAIGRPDAALDSFDLASRLNPLQPDWTNWLKGIAFFTARRYHEAILSFRAINSPMNEVRGWLAASYAMTANGEMASATLEAFLRIAATEMPVPLEPRLSAWHAFWRGAIPYKSDSDVEHLYAALRMAGMPE